MTSEADVQLLHKSNYELLRVVNFLDSAPEPPQHSAGQWLVDYEKWYQTKEKVIEDLQNAFRK